MQPDRADLKRHYDSLSDEALLEINPDDLVETARECLLEELSARGLDASAEPAETEEEAAPIATNGSVAPVAFYETWEEATSARGLLRAADIPSAIRDLRPEKNIQLMVPTELLEDATAVLASEISEEELIAQAEAAGETEFDQEQEEPDDAGEAATDASKEGSR